VKTLSPPKLSRLFIIDDDDDDDDDGQPARHTSDP
jgi:hypothetical protein